LKTFTKWLDEQGERPDQVGELSRRFGRHKAICGAVLHEASGECPCYLRSYRGVEKFYAGLGWYWRLKEMLDAAQDEYERTAS